LVPEDHIQTARPHLHLFNITAILAKLDRIIIEKLRPNWAARTRS
jgi:hypothetical protein